MSTGSHRMYTLKQNTHIPVTLTKYFDGVPFVMDCSPQIGWFCCGIATVDSVSSVELSDAPTRVKDLPVVTKYWVTTWRDVTSQTAWIFNNSAFIISNLSNHLLWPQQKLSLSEQLRGKSCNPVKSYCRKRQASYLIVIHLNNSGPGSSVGIATELWAGRSEIEFRWGRDFPLVQTGPGVHPASCRMGTGYGRGVLLTTHPFLVSRSWKSRAIPLPTLWATPDL